MALTKAEIALLAKLGIGEDHVLKAQAAQARKAAQDAAREALREPMTALIAGSEMTESAKSAWTGATYSFDLDGYGVKVVITDKEATRAREARLKSA
jgi:hypothetical protein